MNHYDSTGRIIDIGDTVSFRGKKYTIKYFLAGNKGRLNTSQIIFNECRHTIEIPDEISVDLVC